MNFAAPMTYQNSYVNQCKDRYEGLMLKDDEKLRGLSCRTTRHIKVKEHMRMGSLCCSTLDLFCR
jgi:hypothetical protein